MPLHVAPLSRRSFLTQTVATAVGMTVLRTGWGAETAADPNLFALLSDTHVPSSPDITARETNMTSNLRRVVQDLVALKTKPASVFVNGDCAYLKGLPADYANFAECVAPLSEAGMPLHVTMGNHDDRGPFYGAFKTHQPARPLVESKHVTVVKSPHANWFLLDSLTEVDVVTGEIGTEQRAWLAKALEAHADKPALVMAHHTPQFEPPAEGKPWGGLRDTGEFLKLLTGFPHVKAFVFGHSHNWAITRHEHLHLINLPPVAYVFAADKPNGWVSAEVQDGGMSLTLHTLDPNHPQSEQKVALRW